MSTARKMENFLAGIGLFSSLIGVAKRQGCLLEAILLQAAFVDALLRIGLVLKQQLAEDTCNIEERLIYQPEGERNISERDVIKRALEHGVIDAQLAENLGVAYQSRNRAVHRLFISEIRYSKLVETVCLYDLLIDHCREIVSELEEEQIHTGKGMTKRSEKPLTEHEEQEEEDRLKNLILRRIKGSEGET